MAFRQWIIAGLGAVALSACETSPPPTGELTAEDCLRTPCLCLEKDLATLSEHMATIDLQRQAGIRTPEPVTSRNQRRVRQQLTREWSGRIADRAANPAELTALAVALRVTSADLGDYLGIPEDTLGPPPIIPVNDLSIMYRLAKEAEKNTNACRRVSG